MAARHKPSDPILSKRPPTSGFGPATISVLFLVACQAPPDARQAWLVDQLQQDNLIWMARDPALLRGKYAKMADDVYDYMRGTSGVFFRDLERAGTERAPMGSELTVAAAAEVLLAGDPHPENIGTFLPGVPLDDPASALRLGINDTDGAAFGPYVWDVRRGALGIATLLGSTTNCNPTSCREQAVRAFARAYADEIAALADDRSTFDPSIAGSHDRITTRLLEDALRDGLDGRRLDRETRREDDDTLRLHRDDALNDSGDGSLPLTPIEALEAEQALTQFAATDAAPPGFVVRDVTRRYGQGVASFPAVRLQVLYDSDETMAQDDDLAGRPRMLQLREVVDPAPVPGPGFAGFAGPQQGIEGLFDSQGERIVEASARLWGDAQTDPNLGWVAVGPRVYKSVSFGSFYQGFSHEQILDDLASARSSGSQLIEWAATLGRVLALAHSDGGTARQADAAEAIAEDLTAFADRAGDDAFVARVVAAAASDQARVVADHARFRSALDELGPWLGAQQWNAGGVAMMAWIATLLLQQALAAPPAADDPAPPAERAPCAATQHGTVVQAAPLGSAPAPSDLFCLRANLDLAGRASLGFPDTGLSRRFDLARGRAELGVVAPAGIGARVALLATRTGGTAGYLGVAGESIVPVVQIAEARMDAPKLGLAVAAGLVDDLWLMGTQTVWDLRVVAPTLGESQGWLHRADLGAWVSWTAPRQIVHIGLSLTTGEGLALRERNEGKNVTGVISLRPLALAGLPAERLEIALFGRKGTRGTLGARDDRVGARLTTETAYLGAGAELIAGFGLAGDATQRPFGTSLWARSSPHIAPLGWARLDLAWAQPGASESQTTGWTVGGGVNLPLKPTPIGRPAYVALAYEGVSRGEGATNTPGSVLEANGHTLWLQLGVRMDVTGRIGMPASRRSPPP